VRRWIADWIWLLVFLALSVGFIIGANSAPNNIPTQQRAEGTSDTKNQTDTVPPSVSQSHAEQGGTKADEKEKHSIWSWIIGVFELKLTDLIIAIFTVVLAVKTSGLFEETAGLRSAADKQSKDMRDSIAAANTANEINRQNFDGVHRPRIRIKHLFLTSDIWEHEVLRVQIAFVNVGIAPAKLIKWGIGASVVRNNRFLEPRPIIPEPHFVLAGVLPSGITMTSGSESTGLVFTDEMNVLVQQQTGKLYCYGFIHYLDGLNNLRTTAFCRHLKAPDQNLLSHTSGWRFVKVDDPDYEYED
jgi:hypothetical protein